MDWKSMSNNMQNLYRQITGHQQITGLGPGANVSSQDQATYIVPSTSRPMTTPTLVTTQPRQRVLLVNEPRPVSLTQLSPSYSSNTITVQPSVTVIDEARRLPSQFSYVQSPTVVTNTQSQFRPQVGQKIELLHQNDRDHVGGISRIVPNTQNVPPIEIVPDVQYNPGKRGHRVSANEVQVSPFSASYFQVKRDDQVSPPNYIQVKRDDHILTPNYIQEKSDECISPHSIQVSPKYIQRNEQGNHVSPHAVQVSPYSSNDYIYGNIRAMTPNSGVQQHHFQHIRDVQMRVAPPNKQWIRTVGEGNLNQFSTMSLQQTIVTPPNNPGMRMMPESDKPSPIEYSRKLPQFENDPSENRRGTAVTQLQVNKADPLKQTTPAKQIKMMVSNTTPKHYSVPKNEPLGQLSQTTQANRRATNTPQILYSRTDDLFEESFEQMEVTPPKRMRRKAAETVLNPENQLIDKDPDEIEENYTFQSPPSVNEDKENRVVTPVMPEENDEDDGDNANLANDFRQIVTTLENSAAKDESASLEFQEKGCIRKSPRIKQLQLKALNPKKVTSCKSPMKASVTAKGVNIDDELLKDVELDDPVTNANAKAKNGVQYGRSRIQPRVNRSLHSQVNEKGDGI